MNRINLKRSISIGTTAITLGAFLQGCFSPQSSVPASGTSSGRVQTAALESGGNEGNSGGVPSLPSSTNQPVSNAPTAGAVPSTSSLTCPSGFVKVPGNTEYAQKDFCVAKYEMKKGSDGKPVSQAAGKPWANQEVPDASAKVVVVTTSVPQYPSIAPIVKKVDNTITRDSAEQLCKSMGAGYDLISNAQWQTIARDITTVGSNWSSGKPYVGVVNSGLWQEVPGYVAYAAGNDDQPCLNSKDKCTKTTWARNKRTHILSNGEIIWDLAGNTGEFIKDQFAFGDYSALYSKPIDLDVLRRNGYTTTDPKDVGCEFGKVRTTTTGTNYCYYTVHEMTAGQVSLFSENLAAQRALIGDQMTCLENCAGNKPLRELWRPEDFGSDREVKTFGSKTQCDKPGEAPYCGYGTILTGLGVPNSPFQYMFNPNYTQYFLDPSELTVENIQKHRPAAKSYVRGKADNVGGITTQCMNPLYRDDPSCSDSKQLGQGIFTIQPAGRAWVGGDSGSGILITRSDNGTDLIGAAAGFRCVYSK